MKATRRVLDARDSTPTIRTNLPCTTRFYGAAMAIAGVVIASAKLL